MTTTSRSPAACSAAATCRAMRVADGAEDVAGTRLDRAERNLGRRQQLQGFRGFGVARLDLTAV